MRKDGSVYRPWSLTGKEMKRGRNNKILQPRGWKKAPFLLERPNGWKQNVGNHLKVKRKSPRSCLCCGVRVVWLTCVGSWAIRNWCIFQKFRLLNYLAKVLGSLGHESWRNASLAAANGGSSPASLGSLGLDPWPSVGSERGMCWSEGDFDLGLAPAVWSC